MIETRSYVGIPALTFLALSVAMTQTTLADMPSWTQYQGNAAHTGYVPVDLNPLAIRPLWSLTPSQAGQSSFVSGIATDEDHIFVSTNKGDGTYGVMALDKLGGTISWTRNFIPYGASISAPSTSNGKVYFQLSGHSDISGGNSTQWPSIMALNAVTGSTVFQTRYEGQWTSTKGVTVTGSQLFAPGGYYGGINAYNASTGQLQWSTSYSIFDDWIATADNHHVYIYNSYSSNDSLHKFDRQTGANTAILTQNNNSTITNAPFILGSQNNGLIVTTRYTQRSLDSVDLSTGQLQWRLSGSYRDICAIGNGKVFATTVGTLDVIDEATGTVLSQWFGVAGNYVEYLTGNLVVTDTLAFVQSNTTTYAIDLYTMTTVWSANITGNIALGDDVLVISNANAIYVFAVPEPMTVIWLLAASAVGWLRRRR